MQYKKTKPEEFSDRSNLRTSPKKNTLSQENPFLERSSEAEDSGTQSSNPFSTAPAQLKKSGSELIQRKKPESSKGTPIRIPNTREFSNTEKALWFAIRTGASFLPGIGPLINILLSAHSLAQATNTTIGIGVSGGGAAGAGLDGGMGIYFDPDGNIGFYGSGSFKDGFLFGIAANFQVTVVKGGVENFGGTCYAFGAGGGEVVVGGLSLLFTTDMDFLGISGTIGVGVGIPFEFYFEAQRTWTSDPVASPDD